jgi:transketolase
MDAVQRARSGHPGMPMGMADIAQVLWTELLRHNPANPDWPDRDRFVLSNGHGSMLQYALLHLSGYALSLDDLRDFRQLHSKTPGHPERGYTPGVETTTGPLGQGLANGVGMALAERLLAARFNRDGHEVVDHHTYVFAGDGCLMEGISHEACSLAGTLGLSKLVVVYDDNGISIDGPVGTWFTDDTPARFRAYGWHVIEAGAGHDPAAVRTALEAARDERERPSLLCCRTVIGWGAPNKAGTEGSHGSPLGEDEVAAARERMGWPHSPFVIPDEIYAGWDGRPRGDALESDWRARFERYREAHPALAEEFERRTRNDLPADWAGHCDRFVAEVAGRGLSIATRKASQEAIEGLGPTLPELVGGSADLAGSNLTLWSGAQAVTGREGGGNYVYFGVREFGMSAILNGMALHGAFIPYGATFLVFSEYARNALRMAALMRLRQVFVYTHDSIGLGEDGPTHQAVEQTATLRMIPNMSVWRPCDAVESAVAWRLAVERKDGPSCLLFSRQSLPHMERSSDQIQDIGRGGYVLRDCDGDPAAVLLATGSEVGLAAAAAERLAGEGIPVRLVSMPCTDRFDAQPQTYRDAVLPSGVPRVAVEAGVTAFWRKYVGESGEVVGIDSFGESAPAEVVFAHFGFTPERIVEAVQAARARLGDAPPAQVAGG